MTAGIPLPVSGGAGVGLPGASAQFATQPSGSGPPGTNVYTYATLPAANSAPVGSLIYTSDQGTLYSNGAQWLPISQVVQAVYTFATLPAASQFPFYIAVTTDQGIVFSNGSSWTIITGGQGLLAGLYTYATLPSAVTYAYKIAMTTDQGPVYSNGAQWLLLYNQTNATLGIATGTPLPNGTNGTAYSQTITYTNGTPPITPSIASTFGASNAYTITAASATTATLACASPATNTNPDNIMVQGTDATGASVQKLFTIKVNASGGTQAATPTFSPAAGTYTSAQTVTISCSTPSSTIYYTTNNTTPTTSSPVYSSPISVSISQTVQAIATATGYTQSNVGSAAYVINAYTYKFVAGYIYMTQGNQGGTPAPPASQNWQTEIGYLMSNSQGMIGYELCSLATQLESWTSTSNLALQTAANGGPIGATGSALQTAINTQYPGFRTRIEACFYYLQAACKANNLSPMYLSVCINNVYGGANAYSVTDVKANWATNGRVTVPQYVVQCGGSLTVPDYYGASTTTLYSGGVAPVYYGQTYSDYGFGFANNNGSTTYFTYVLPHFHNPPVNQVTIQLWQALAQYTFSDGTGAWVSGTAYTVGQACSYGGGHYICYVATSGTTNPASDTAHWMVNSWFGQTLDSCPLICSLRTLDEYSWYQTSSNNISGVSVNPPTTGGAAYNASAAHFWNGWYTKCQKITAAFPHTMFAVCMSYGYDGITNDGTPASYMAAHINNNFTQQSGQTGLSAVQGVAFGGADTYVTDYIVQGGAIGANQSKVGYFGNSTGGTTTFAPNASYWVKGYMPVFSTVEPLDFIQGLTPVCGSGNNTATVKGICSSAMTIGSSLVFMQGCDNTGAYSTWGSYINPAINGPATSCTTTTITDTAATWPTYTSPTINLVGFTVQITSGAQAGQTSTITANTATQITFSPAISGLSGTPGFIIYNAQRPTNLP